MNIKRHRRMTKHRKGTTKPRKSIRKTRRQSGGFGWDSFIRAEENYVIAYPVGGIQNDPDLMFQMVKATTTRKGIDVKVKTVDGQRKWLIGGKDLTLQQLQSGGKEGRYEYFISVLLRECPDFTFDDGKSKGIILTDDQFCKIFIGKQGKLGTAMLNYTRLQERFRDKGLTCTSGSASGSAYRPPSSAYHPPPSAYHPPSSAYHPPPSAAQQYWQREQPQPFTKLSDIGMGSAATAMPRQLQEWPQPSAAQPHWSPSSAYHPPLSAEQAQNFQKLKQRLEDIGCKNVTDEMIVTEITKTISFNLALNNLIDEANK